MTDQTIHQFSNTAGHPFAILNNQLADAAKSWSPEQDAILSDTGLAQARETIESWPGYQPTPLHALGAWADRCGVSQVHYKDEAPRFGLGSFKALGGAYAVARLLQREIARRSNSEEPDISQLLNGQHGTETGRITVCCATDGNHGRSVAWGAQRFGCQCVIFIHETVSEARQRAIEAYGATVIRTAGNYDDSVREAQRSASENTDWFVVSDTSYPGYVDIPKDVMQGYELMAAEADQQMPRSPTHLFLQTGVGGMAAAIAAYYVRRYGAARPKIVLADPQLAACWLSSIEAGVPTAVSGNLGTVMAGLACGEVSLLAWSVLRDHADAVVAVPDESVAGIMTHLAHPLGNDPAIVAGESAVAGLLAATMTAEQPQARDLLGLTEQSRILVFGTEGDTDPALYQELVGLSGDEIRQLAS